MEGLDFGDVVVLPGWGRPLVGREVGYFLMAQAVALVVHEAGHYAVAKVLGRYVVVQGFGTVAGLIGFVQVSFKVGAPKWAQVLVALGGVLFNALFCGLLVQINRLILSTCDETGGPSVAWDRRLVLYENFGVLPGDRIGSINGVRFSRATDLPNVVSELLQCEFDHDGGIMVPNDVTVKDFLAGVEFCDVCIPPYMILSFRAWLPIALQNVVVYCILENVLIRYLFCLSFGTGFFNLIPLPLTNSDGMTIVNILTNKVSG